SPIPNPQSPVPSPRYNFPTVAKINDVAKSAGVSTATVSRVLSNAAIVAPATRRRVMAAVERLGYAPHATRKNLRMLRTRRLLVTVPDISRPLFSLILQGIEETANAEVRGAPRRYAVRP